MRELKFRAWKMFNGKLRRCVCSPFGLLDYAQRHPEAPVLHHEDVNDIRDFMPNADVIEQYTGLKDKYGKEIYEGDIVDYNDDGDCIGVVKYISPKFEIMERTGFTCWLKGGHHQRVIGNIHENPELLGDTNITNKEEE